MWKHGKKLHALAFGFALGLMSAIFTFILGLFAIRGYGLGYVNMLSTVYIGFGPSFLGSIVGAIWAFCESFIFGAIFAALYNCFACCCKGRGGWSKWDEEKRVFGHKKPEHFGGVEPTRKVDTDLKL